MPTVSLIMPTYQRDFIIGLAIESIVHQREHGCDLELIIGDDGDDRTEEVVQAIHNPHPRLTIHYLRMPRIPLSDKRNQLVRHSTGTYFGVVDSDDIQSPYKIAAFEKALEAHPEANIFGQREFLYHDIIDGRTVRWTQNRALESFKAGSFMILCRDFWERSGGYPPGLWRGVDSAFAATVDSSHRRLCDLGEMDPRLLDTTIALQHISNIWRRKAKGLKSGATQQLANYVATPVAMNERHALGPNLESFIQHQETIRSLRNPGLGDSLRRLAQRLSSRLNRIARPPGSFKG